MDYNIYSIRIWNNKYLLEINGRIHIIENKNYLKTIEKTLKMLGYHRILNNKGY